MTYTDAAGLHLPVMLSETIEHLKIKKDGIYVDSTFGYGGHTKAILALLSAEGRVLAIDRDPDAINTGSQLMHADSRLELIHAEFSQLGELVKSRGITGKVNGILFDLGVSSPQLDTAERGFSFMRDGPLDMRMNPQSTKINAAQWLAKASKAEIAEVLYNLGEERYAKRIAQAIITTRHQQPILCTAQLANIIKQAHPAWERDKHPATRSFQAIRIHINRELEELKLGLKFALDVLAMKGRLLTISFHSLEDRIVKQFFRHSTRGDHLPRSVPIPFNQTPPKLQLPVSTVRPSITEIKANPRARSAVLRVAEKCL
ncbi:16S rRNA methyltransferase [Achromatium sp. WMS1]|nr:16S rRNA methyltransferase [Achromatium sp. WMS1]